VATEAKPVFAAMQYTDPKTGLLTGGAQQALSQWQTAITTLQSQVATLQADVAALQKGAK
jgi:outer membrane murein-binding lipoprotein Lpp